MRYYTRTDNQEYLIEIIDENHIRMGDQIHEVDFVSAGAQPVYSLIMDGKSYEAYVYPEDESWQVLLIGRQYQVRIMDEREQRLGAATSGGTGPADEYQLKAPMPGLVVAVPIKEGQHVDKGQVLLVLESMKMQNELRSPRSGTVTHLRVRSGESVEQKQPLVNVA